MLTFRQKIVAGILTILLMVLPNTVIAAVGSSTNYILDIADTSGAGLTGSSTNYTITGTADGGYQASSPDNTLCGGYMEEALGVCDPPVVPPPTLTPPVPSAGGGSIPTPPAEPEQPQEDEAAAEEEYLGPLVITLDEDDSDDQPESPSIDEPGTEGDAPDVTEPGEGGFILKKPYEKRDDSELYAAPLDEEVTIVTPEVPETEGIPLEWELTEPPLRAAAEKLPIECTWLLILFIILTLILATALLICRFCITKKTKQKVKKDIHNCLKKFK